MKGFIEITDPGDYRQLINIHRIERVREGDDGSNEGAHIFIKGSGGNSIDTQEKYEAVRQRIQWAQDEDELPISTEAVGFMAEEESADVDDD
ncbi:hypothetical protein [Sporolactobacillus sp. KGMB 08714]|uniref:hypothetical protein n=1 Tax=Sporolactobacillus sp. KGMB 08714 TaxID=3064704 RepID=UPI002FBDEEB9